MRFSFSIAALALCLAATPARPEAPPPFPEFTFKRVKPPAPGTTRRITVQIETPPAAPAAVAPPADDAAAPAGDRAAAAPSGFDWFWAQVPPEEEGAQGAARMARALAVLGRGPAGAAVPGPRLDTLRRIADRHGTEILKATIGTRVSPAFVLAVIAVESGGRADAISRAGAEGLMQLMPGTAQRFGVRDAFSAPQNIRGGVGYLDWLLDAFGGDAVLALAGYNAGENAVRKYAGVPPYAETRAYVPKVLAAWNVARGLCLTPPELVSDGCVFVTGRIATNG